MLRFRSVLRWSRLFIPTLREDPAEAEGLGHKLLLRAGYLRHRDTYLFLGQRSLSRIAAIVRGEMDAIGAQEVCLPGTEPGQAVASLARELRSYRQLPQVWYAIGTEVEAEPRPRQWLHHHSYTLAAAEDLAAADTHFEAYRRIFARCGVVYETVGRRFLVRSESGEGRLVECPRCGYKAGLDEAVTRAAPPASADPEGDLDPEEFHTPGVKTIADLAAFTGLPETSQIKSLVLSAGRGPVLALVRGDHQLSEAKLAFALGEQFRPARPDEIVRWFGAAAGSLGPVGISSVRILADVSLRGRRNMIAGANRDDYHLRNVTPEEDFRCEWHELRQAAAGDPCGACGATVAAGSVVEIGRIDAGIEAGGVRVVSAAGRDFAPVMGSGTIAIDRILHVAVEQSSDTDGMALPPSIAPFQVIVTPVNGSDPAQMATAERLYQECRGVGLESLLDDRDERAGVKFKDADLLGVPYRITVGKKAAGGTVEVVDRRKRTKSEVSVDGAAGVVAGGVEGDGD
jgi:prolyl-tRNA synthetase